MSSHEDSSSEADDAEALDQLREFLLRMVTQLSQEAGCRSMSRDDFFDYVTAWFKNRKDCELPLAGHEMLLGVIDMVFVPSTPPTVAMEVDPEDMAQLTNSGYRRIDVPNDASPEFIESFGAGMILIDTRGETEISPVDAITAQEALAVKLLKSNPPSPPCLVYILPGDIPGQDWVSRHGMAFPMLCSFRIRSLDASVCVFGTQGPILPPAFDYWRAECSNDLDLFIILVHTFARDQIPAGEKFVLMGGGRKSRTACMKACVLLSTHVDVFVSEGDRINEREVLECFLAVNGSSTSNDDCCFDGKWCQ
jgi:hypothetical protein